MRTLTLVATLIVAAPVDARGQVHAIDADSLLDRLRARDSVLVERARVVDSLRRVLARPTPPVEVVRGALHIRTVAELEPRVRIAADSVTRIIDRRGGSVIPARVAARSMSLTRDSIHAMVGFSHFITVSPDTARRWSAIAGKRVPLGADVGALAAALTSMAEVFAFEGVDGTLSGWTMVGRVPLGPEPPGEASDVHVELAITESAALRRCRGGDDLACLDVLGIDSVPESRLSRWYAPDDYRSLLRTVAPPRDDSAAVVAWLRCRDERDDDACRAAVQKIPNDRIPPPLSATARFMVLREVLDAGGAGAYDRLVASSGPLRARFAAASGEPIEKTIRRWLARVDHARPKAMPLSGGLVAGSLGWAGALLALTLTRRNAWT